MNQVWNRKPRILLVDDDMSIHMMGESALEAAGFSLYSATSGAEALAKIPGIEPDLILLDIVMPGLNGIDTCERIKSRPICRNIPVIMLTGNDDHESVKTAYGNGAWDFTSKPVNWPILVNRCWHALEASAAFAEAKRAARLSSILDNSHNDIITIDPETLNIIAINENTNARDRLGSDMVGSSILDFLVGFDQDAFAGLIQPLIDGEPQSSFSTELRCSDGSTLPCEGLILQSTDDLDRQVYIAILRDISDRRQREEEVYSLQFFDLLTGLPNRLLVRERIEQAITISRRTREFSALMVIDLDGFKLVNDALGYAIGDRTLQTVAERLKDIADRQGENDAVRSADIQVARLGGDQFLLLITGFEDPIALTMIAEEMLKRIQQPILAGEHEISITGSIGVSIHPNDGSNIDELMLSADAAMYDAKSRGKNTFSFYNDSESVRSLQILTTESQLRRAVEKNELFLNYQVQTDNLTGRVAGLEALVRWNHPERGYVSPGEFIPIAESTSLIIDIGNYVIAQVFRDSATWLRNTLPHDCEIAINISNRHLQHESFTRSLEDCLQRYKPAHKIVIEITESSVMRDTSENGNHLQTLRDLGMNIAIDDFGTGYSSLSYLKDLPVDCLKVDQSFVRNIETSETDFAIVKVIFNLARMLGLSVVAEGVETLEQAELLNKCGAHLVQGYLISKPLGAMDLLDFFEVQDRLVG